MTNPKFDLSQLSLYQKLSMIAENARLLFKLAAQISPLYLGLMMLMGLLSVFILAFQAVVARDLINSIVAANSADLSPVLALVLAAFMGMAAQNVISIIDSYAKRRFSDDLQLKINVDILKHAVQLDVRQYDQPELRDILERVRTDVAFFISHFITEIILWVTRFFELFSILLLLVAIDISIVFLMAPFVLIYLIFNWRQSEDRFNLERQQTVKRRWTWYFQEILTAPQYLAESRLLNLAPLSIQRYSQLQEEYMQAMHRIYRKQHIGELGFSLSISLMLHIAIIFVIVRVIDGVLTIGDVALYLRIATRLRDNLHILINSFSLILQDVLNILNWREFMQTQATSMQAQASAVQAMRDSMPLTNTLRGDIVFEEVSFHYGNPERLVLDKLSFSIQAGEVVALVGENGAGKTTIARLIAGLYQPSSGRILVDGVDLQRYPPEFYRQQVGYVFQQVTHYEASAQDNIAFGDWQGLLGQQDAVQAIARKTQVHDMIESFPQGYATHLGLLFGHFTPSGGQWQRLAIARALAKNPRLLILDEPTANMDIRAEYELFQHFKNLVQGCTSVLISHRFSSVQMADRILVLEKGKVIEQGSHAELLAQNGAYAALYRLSQRQQ